MAGSGGNWPTKGSIESTEGEPIKVEFDYNPKEYSVSKQNTWSQPNANRGTDSAALQFGGGNPKQIKLSLFFDTFEDGEDVRASYTNNLFKMMEIQSDLPQGGTGTANGQGQPPQCKLQWGKVWTYFCYLESVSCQFNLFLSDGTPVRAQCEVGLKQAVDEKDQPKTNPSSGGEGGERSITVRPADRLDLIAHRVYGNAKMWRVIAQANGITNARALRAGQKLIIPPPTS